MARKPSDSSRQAAKAAERLAVIVDAAERAALNVIDDAEKEARRYLLEAQAKADRIVAERLREAADMLEGQGPRPAESRPAAPGPAEPPAREAAFEETPAFEPAPVEDDAGEEAEEPRGLDEVEEAAPAASPPPPEPPAPPRPRGAGRGGSAAARLLATQMAVSGSSRQEIEMRLRSGFDIDDTSEILDAILGPEG